ncbi:MAG: DUF4345 domain-containing protein [Rhodospirillales bacterium]|nr:DUF4345 domain-containing protein [Rhodospirillales bacterium]
MKTFEILKSILLLSGGVAAAIGTTILIVPDIFYATYGITIDTNPSALSETRASGGSLLAMGVLMIAGYFVSALTFTATLIAVLVYMSYGLSRALSFVLDGWPDSGLIGAAVFELAIGSILAITLIRYRQPLRMRPQHP